MALVKEERFMKVLEKLKNKKVFALYLLGVLVLSVGVSFAYFSSTNSTSGSSDGNRALQYPIGLISLDEAWYAGGYTSSNQSYYLYTGPAYWTMSPKWYHGNAFVFLVSSYGDLHSNNYVNAAFGMRPVINLKADVTISSGNGTASNPYVIS